MKIFLDTDLNFPSDDFQALMFFLAAADVEIVGCGAAAGNAWAEEVFANIRLVAEILGEQGLNVWKGIPHAQFAPRHDFAVTAKTDRVRNFIGAYEKSVSPRVWVTGRESDHSAVPAMDALLALSHEHADDLSIVCIGPLSNLGAALKVDPRLSERLKSVIVMGGYFSSSAETEAKVDFNFWFDPEAAHKVLNSDLNIRLVPLDVCQSARLTAALLQRIARFDRGRAALFVDDFLGMVRQHGPTMALADQLVAVLHLAPALILDEQRARVDVDFSDGLARGKSTLVADPTASVRVVRQIDVEGAHDLMLDLVARMSEQYCKPFDLFGTPSYQYFLGQCLANGPITVLNADCDHHRYTLNGVSELQSPAELASTMAPLARLMINAKEESELWLPGLLAGAAIEQSYAARDIALDQLTLKELEHLIFERFRNIRAIATISAPGDAPRGFACLSELAPERLQELELRFDVGLPRQSILLEYSIIAREACGPSAVEHIGSQLLLWYSALRPAAEEIRVLTVAPASEQDVTRNLLRMGYKPAAQCAITEGHAQGTVVILYSLMLNERALSEFRSRYGDVPATATSGN
jgi:inosine-uridine nucleoside N-ribohydrolase